MAKELALLRLAAAAGELRCLRGAFELCAARVRGLALDSETRLLELGVPMAHGALAGGREGVQRSRRGTLCSYFRKARRHLKPPPTD